MSRLPDFWPETLPPWRKPRRLMRAISPAGDPEDPYYLMWCRHCDGEFDDVYVATFSLAKRGIPCPTCNPGEPEMTQKELIDRMYATQSQATNALRKSDLEFVVTLFRATIGDALAKGESAELPGLLSLKPEMRNPRPGRNPRTGEPMTIPAKRVVKVKVLAALKNKVAQS